MRVDKLRKVAAVTVGGGALVFGVGSSAFAEGEISGFMSNWESGDRGSTWYDYASDATETRVTFSVGCSREFTARIRREKLGPDTTVASEHIDCGSYTDSVRAAGYQEPDDYHFDIQLPGGSCGKFNCFVPRTSAAYTEHW